MHVSHRTYDGTGRITRLRCCAVMETRFVFYTFTFLFADVHTRDWRFATARSVPLLARLAPDGQNLCRHSLAGIRARVFAGRTASFFFLIPSSLPRSFSRDSFWAAAVSDRGVPRWLRADGRVNHVWHSGGRVGVRAGA